MATLAQEMLATAEELINDPEIGQLCTMTQRRSVAASDPSKPHRTKQISLGPPDDTSLRVAIVPSQPSKRLVGVAVQSHRAKAYIAASSVTIEPEKGDLITDASGNVWAVHTVTPYQVASTVAAYEMDIRR